MKIGHPADKHAPAVTTNGTTAAPSSTPENATAIPAKADPSAKIALSNTASSLLSNESVPEFDSEKVGRISKQLEDGTFRVNPEAIADKLLANAKELVANFQQS